LWPNFDRNLGINSEPLPIKLGVIAGLPHLLNRKIDLVAKRRIPLPDTNAERLYAEPIRQDHEIRLALGKSLEDVEAAGQRIRPTLRQRQPSGVVILEAHDLRLGRCSCDILFKCRALLYG